MIRLITANNLAKIILFVASLITAFAVANISAPKAQASYRGDRLIDNSVFLHSNSMSRNQIQDFLVSMNSGLKDMTFQLQCYGAGSKEREWYTAAGAQCDTQIPASHVIYYAAQIYGVNPRVILATMQKEQSLITAPNPTNWQLSQAMGYGCPTSGSCSDSSNFSYQVDSGTWVLRFHYERARGNMTWWRTDTTWTCGSEKNFYKPSLYPNSNTRFYDGNGVHYRTYNLYNAATSSFYCYTPHAYNNPNGLFGHPKYGTKGQYYSGSYNFVLFFRQWFGSTFIDNVRLIECDEQKYLVERNIRQKRLISANALTAWGFENMHFAQNDSGCNYSTYTLPLEWLIRSRNTGRVYMVDQGNAYRVHDSTASAWGLGNVSSQDYPQFDPPSITSNLTLVSKLPQVATSTNPSVKNVYIVSGGKRHTIAGTQSEEDESLRLVRGYDNSPVPMMSVPLLQTLTNSTALDYSFKVGSNWYMLNHANLVRINGSSATRWQGVLNGPTLNSDVLNLFSKTASINTGFERSGYRYHVTSEGELKRTESPTIISSYWNVANEPTITRLLTGKITNDLPPETVFGIEGNVRLISCDEEKYLVERNRRNKRKISDDALTYWNFDNKYFNEGDRGCEYPAYALELDRLIRSRNTGRVYYIHDAKAYLVHSQAAENEYGLGDTSSQTYPQFDPASIHDSLGIVRHLPSGL